uniref:RME-8_N domain-containing protein n=1 Tax=Heterorhabditis bacteriophora TaxID=37862 RepID=A0A1I7WJ59_HETBA
MQEINLGAWHWLVGDNLDVGLSYSPSMTIVKGAGMVMRAIIEESDVETSKAMQMLALTEGAFLTHLHMSLLSTGRDLRASYISLGHLIGLWIADNQPANDLLSRSLVSIIFLIYIIYPFKFQLNIHFYIAKFDHFKHAIEGELRSLVNEKEQTSLDVPISWNHTEFQVFLLSKLALNKENVRELIVAQLLPLLVDLAVLAHLHVQRAKIQNQVVIIKKSSMFIALESLISYIMLGAILSKKLLYMFLTSPIDSRQMLSGLYIYIYISYSIMIHFLFLLNLTIVFAYCCNIYFSIVIFIFSIIHVFIMILFQVCEHICNCLSTASRFEACRQRIAEMPTIFKNISQLLQFSVCGDEEIFCIYFGRNEASFDNNMLTVYAKELIVGDIFVRIYNEQATFTQSDRYLINICCSTNGNKLSSVEKVLMCLTALANLITANSANVKLEEKGKFFDVV